MIPTHPARLPASRCYAGASRGSTSFVLVLRDVPLPRFLLDAISDHAAKLKLGKNAVLCRTPERNPPAP